jgi:hypothetical protein
VREGLHRDAQAQRLPEPAHHGARRSLRPVFNLFYLPRRTAVTTPRANPAAGSTTQTAKHQCVGAPAALQVLPLGAADNLFPLEVHIRTGEMHRLAQYGIACERWVGFAP